MELTDAHLRVLVIKASTHCSGGISVALLCNQGQCINCSLPNLIDLVFKARTHCSNGIKVALLCNLGPCLNRRWPYP